MAENGKEKMDQPDLSDRAEDAETLDLSTEKLDQSADLSDPEDAESLDLSPFHVDWLDLEFAHCPQKLGICALPGCRFKKTWRSMSHDLTCLKEMGVEDVFCLCTKGEFYFYRTMDLLEKYTEAGFTCHHHPVEDMQLPTMAALMNLVDEMRACLMAGRKTIIHCYGGLGRSCSVAACLMMVMDPNLTHEEATEKLRALKGDRAIQSVKQYNFINEFRDQFNSFLQENKGSESRSVSR